MPATVIPLSEAGAWVARLGRSMPEAAHRGLVSAAHRLAGHMKVQDLPLDRGTMRAGWQAEKTDDGAAVFNKTIEATLVEGGVRPENVKVGKKMIDALTEWARRKGVGTKQAQGKKRSFVDFASGNLGSKAGKARVTQVVWRRVRASEGELRSIAWGIAKSIQKRGLFEPENGGLRPLEKETRRMGPEFVRQEVLRSIKEEFSK